MAVRRVLVYEQEVAGFSPLAARPSGRLSIVQFCHHRFVLQLLQDKTTFLPKSSSTPRILLLIRRNKKRNGVIAVSLFMAGVAGFEPTNDGVRGIVENPQNCPILHFLTVF